MSFSTSNNYIIVVTVVVPRVCVCLFVVVLPPRASRPRCTCSPRNRKLFYIIIIIAENASFKRYGVICLPRMPLTSYSGATKYGDQRNPRNVGMTLLFAVLTKKRFVQKFKHIPLPSSCAYLQYKNVYIHN